MGSIGRRLGVSLFVSLLLAGLLAGQAALWWLDREQRLLSGRQLRDETTSVLAAIVRGRDGLVLDEDRLDPAYRKPLSGRYFVVLIGDQRWRSRSLWDARLPLPARTGMDTDLRPGPGGQSLLRYRAEFRRDGQALTVVVAQNYAPQLAKFQELKTAALIAWVLLLAVLALVQQYLIRRGLRPLQKVRRQIGQLRGGERAELDRDVVAELRPLVEEINRLQHHTEQQLARSRHALGDLGHALKTPLSVLRNRCNEELRRQSPELYRLLVDQLDQIENTVGRALGRARVAAGATAATRFEPARDVPVLLDTLRRAHDRPLKLTAQGYRLPALPLERDDMLELLGNLMDNGCKWAAGRVELRLHRQADLLQVTVDDDGPGIEPERHEDVLQRGGRLDQRVPGHGLGLAIVNDTVEAYGGTLALERSPLGGLRVSVRLPFPG
ncbi:ATP-binding protein [Alcanivorax marinus]|uniref:histidine kinase n=1 Tax=Alloalcanivorax marinus TaxID=1177169 RepID=A0A9Q3UKS5_9GAMM|nr:ATP-binding protein [Alloalcanivorax marinus]MCC4308015.1 ATP-binding protein [Alloalcanivorax marinus]MCU5785109.1 ATP-binding region ATPase domain-containing protein [Alloalcanivorax marinus]